MTKVNDKDMEENRAGMEEKKKIVTETVATRFVANSPLGRI